MKNDFILRTPSRIIFGCGKFSLLNEEVRNLLPDPNQKVLLVMDPAVQRFVLPKAEKILSGIKLATFVIQPGEPTVEAVDQAAEQARKENPALVVGIGGGSAMDTAKALAALVTNPGSSEKYRGQNLLTAKPLPNIMVPTTAGTGSELSPTAVLIGGGRKGGINSPHLIPQAALLDPELTVPLPPEPTMATGLDALAHAVESYLSKNSSDFTEPLSIRAVSLITKALPRAVADGTDIEARTNMMLGNLLGGITLANAGVVFGHSLSYPLGARYRVSHGVANGILLPYVLAENLEFATGKIALMARTLGLSTPAETKGKQAKKAIDFLFDFEKKIGFSKRLRDFGVPENMLKTMVEEAQKVAVPIANNPKPMTGEDLLRVYQSVY